MMDVRPNSKGTVIITTENGKVYKQIEFAQGGYVKLPIEKNGTVKWFDDAALLNKL